MNQLLKRLFTLGMAITLLFGCSTANDNSAPSENDNAENQPTEEASEEVVTITISKDEGEEVLADKEVAMEDGAILMDVLKENFEIEEEGGFIQAIDGVVAEEDEKMFWAIIVNDEMAEVGAAEYELEANDHVEVDLQSWE
jgi:hypothetical protein